MGAGAYEVEEEKERDMKKKAKTVSAFQALKDLSIGMNSQDEGIKRLLNNSSSIEDLQYEVGDRIVDLRSKGMTIKAISKKIHRRDRYVSAVLGCYVGAIGLPKIMTPARRKHLRKLRGIMERRNEA